MIEDNLDVQHHLLNLKRNFGGFFAPNREIFLTRAPGRLNVVGGGIDFTGATIIQFPIQEAIIATIQKRLDRRILIRSIANFDPGFNLIAEFNLDSLFAEGRLKSPDQIRSPGLATETTSWVDHVAGVFYQLFNTGAIQQLPCGATIGLSSNLPIRYNLSASGALYVVILQALKILYQLDLDNLNALNLCEKVAGEFMAAPGGIGDHITPALGARGKLLIHSTAADPIQIPIPEGYRLVGIGATPSPAIATERHLESRVGMMMGQRILLEAMKQPDIPDQPNQIVNFLIVHLRTENLAQQIRKLLPAKMLGKEFQRQFKSHDDPYTRIEANREYHIRSHVVHAVQEHIWATQMVNLLTDTESDANERMIQVGQIMYEAHALRNRSYRLRSKYSDLIVDLVKKAGPEQGFLGAIATGKGGGGTVAILTREDTIDILRNFLAQIAEVTNHSPYLFSGSSNGAFGFNTITTRLS